MATRSRTQDEAMVPTYSPDADAEGADWTKKSWDFPPYKSADFFKAIGGIEKLDDFRSTSAYRGAVNRGLIYDDEWVFDWAVPDDGTHHDATEEHEPGKPRRGIHVHVHR